MCTWSPFTNGIEWVPFAVGAGIIYCTKQAHKAHTNNLEKGPTKELYEELPPTPLKAHYPWNLPQWRHVCKALGLGTLCMVVCSIRPTKLALVSLDTHLKPGDHDGAIVAYLAKVRFCQSTLTWLGNAISWGSETLGAWYCLGKYRRQANLLMWESISMPLLPLPTPN